MVKKLLTALLLLPLAAAAQNVPDNEDIFARTLDSSSPYYYPSLMMRYNAGDTTLTHEDYYYLYYGYPFTDSYKPLENIPAETKILAVLERNPEPGPGEAAEIIEYAGEAARSDPFSPRNLNYLVYAYGILGDTINERINYVRYKNIMDVIDASGSGLKESSPKHVLRFSHAADFIESRGLLIRRRTVVSRTAEFIALLENDGPVKGYYFDFSRVYWNRPDDEQPSPERRSWKINDMPIRRKTPSSLN